MDFPQRGERIVVCDGRTVSEYTLMRPPLSSPASLVETEGYADGSAFCRSRRFAGCQWCVDRSLLQYPAVSTSIHATNRKPSPHRPEAHPYEASCRPCFGSTSGCGLPPPQSVFRRWFSLSAIRVPHAALSAPPPGIVSEGPSANSSLQVRLCNCEPTYADSITSLNSLHSVYSRDSLLPTLQASQSMS